MEFSNFGTQFTGDSAILQLMDDLGEALAAGSDMQMLGGGNPAHIPEVQAYFRRAMLQLLDDNQAFEHTIGDYDSPQGNAAFINALAALLRTHCGWDIEADNIALTTGSQCSFFFLFNLLGGSFSAGRKKKILFPMLPEYIGYADLGIERDLLTSITPNVEHLEDHQFKYRVDFSNLEISEDIGAICLSRPTNPTGNVVTDEELRRLSTLTQSHGIPLIIDSAYGLPFPNIVFVKAQPVWNENIVVCMSLSKLGLPGVRTGIVIANKTIIQALSKMNAICSLAPSSLGPALTQQMIQTGQILALSDDIIKPFYHHKAQQTVAWLKEALTELDFHIHKPEGAIFLWLWLRGLPISSHELYQRLKQRGVIVVPGHHFFPGMQTPWPHSQECIRVTYAQSPEAVQKGIEIIGEEVRKAYA